MKLLFRCLAISITCLWGCVSTGGPNEVIPAAHEEFFISNRDPAKITVQGNPLRYAAKRIDLDLDSFELPDTTITPYRFTCRYPVIDAVANRPLYMKQWAEETTAMISAAHEKNGLAAIKTLIDTLRGGDDKVIREADDIPTLPSVFTKAYQAALSRLFVRYAEACRLTAEGRSLLSREDLEFLRANPGRFLVPDGKKMPQVTTQSLSQQMDFVARIRRVKFETIFAAAAVLADAVEEYKQATRTFTEKDFFADPGESRKTVTFDTPYGKVVIAGFGDDTHETDAAVLIDLGGNDLYTNETASTLSVPGGVALCIDHSGDDKYLTPDRSYTQGFGFLGVGYLVDLAGNDQYTAKHFCQGVGIAGVGAVFDLSGNDLFDAHTFCQGTAMFGVGALMDSAGDDQYDCASNGQGSATTLGMGVLSDLSGNDTYRLATNPSKDAFGQDLRGYGQGGAFSFRPWPVARNMTPYGGVGILTDHRGDDHYISNGWCDQGGSYLMSLGVLVDDDGNDHYKNTRGGGSTIHLGNAIMIDRNGNDVYETQFLGFGSGSDRSPGIFIDYHGNDVYGTEQSTASMGSGCKPKGFSLFIDYEGTDRYLAKQPTTGYEHDWDSVGGVWPESEADQWPYAVCLDLGGADDYRIAQRANDSERLSYGHGIHLDTVWKGGDVIGHVDNPLEPYLKFPLPESVMASPYGPLIQSLQSPDLFTRFQVIGLIVGKGSGAVPWLVEAIRSSTHRQFNRDVMECLHMILCAQPLKEDEIHSLRKLITAADEEVRVASAYDHALWKFVQNEEALAEALLTDASSRMRESVFLTLSLNSSPKALSLASRLALQDPSESIRRRAVGYLGTVDIPGSTDLILGILDNDPSFLVRIEAARVFTRVPERRALKPLQRAARSDDVYLRREAAKALALLGEIDGIKILIDSMSFTSIDANYNYDRNIPNDISVFANVDFPRADRYRQEVWQKWFSEHRGEIMLKENVAAYLRYVKLAQELPRLSDEQAIARYEEIFAERPDYLIVRNRLRSLLNRLAWNRVTADKSTSGYDPKMALRYAMRAAELAPDAAILDTLAAAYDANGEREKAIAVCRDGLKQYPGNPDLQKRLDGYLKDSQPGER